MTSLAHQYISLEVYDDGNPVQLRVSLPFQAGVAGQFFGTLLDDAGVQVCFRIAHPVSGRNQNHLLHFKLHSIQGIVEPYNLKLYSIGGVGHADTSRPMPERH